MVTKTNLLTLLALATATVQGSPVQKRAVVPHDSIAPFGETVPNSATGNTYKTFEPYLHIAHGCQSYPAVAANGDTRYVLTVRVKRTRLNHSAAVACKTPAAPPAAAATRAKDRRTCAGAG